MSVLNGEEIAELLDRKVVEGAEYSNINASSLDIRLGKFIMVETMARSVSGYTPHCLSLRQREPLNVRKVDIEEAGHYILAPGEFILAHSIEVFHLPNDLSAEYKLKSSMARIGLEHLTAGWCDAGWNASVLTLELRNMTTYHEIELLYGDRIGQIVFFPHKPVPDNLSYATRGAYNGDVGVSSAKPARVIQPLDTSDPQI